MSCRRPIARFRESAAAFRLDAFLVLALFAAITGCSKAGGRPVAGDLSALLAEAAATEGEAPEEGSPERRAVRDALRRVLETEKKCGDEIGRLFWRPELTKAYLLHDHSFVGGKFPLGTAVLLREVEELETKVLAAHREFPKLLADDCARAGMEAVDSAALVSEMSAVFAARRRPVLAAIAAHQKLVVAIAELYELVGSEPDSIRSMRDGLEISDGSLLESYNAQVDTVNEAIDATNVALESLPEQERAKLHWMGLVERKRR